jgi:hypothetical protein
LDWGHPNREIESLKAKTGFVKKLKYFSKWLTELKVKPQNLSFKYNTKSLYMLALVSAQQARRF